MIDLERLIRDLKISKKHFAEQIGKSPSAISNVIYRDMPVPDAWLDTILKKFRIQSHDTL